MALTGVNCVGTSKMHWTVTLMRERKTQLTALLEALFKAGFEPEADFDQGSIALTVLPEFREKPVFALIIVMETPHSEDWEELFEGCALESGRMLKGAPHKAGIFSRKKAVERAKQEKWVATWALYDAAILPSEPRPCCEKWQDMPLP